MKQCIHYRQRGVTEALGYDIFMFQVDHYSMAKQLGVAIEKLQVWDIDPEMHVKFNISLVTPDSTDLFIEQLLLTAYTSFTFMHNS